MNDGIKDGMEIFRREKGQRIALENIAVANRSNNDNNKKCTFPRCLIRSNPIELFNAPATALARAFLYWFGMRFIAVNRFVNNEN